MQSPSQQMSNSQLLGDHHERKTWFARLSSKIPKQYRMNQVILCSSLYKTTFTPQCPSSSPCFLFPHNWPRNAVWKVVWIYCKIKHVTLRKILLCYTAITLIHSEGWKTQPQSHLEEEIWDWKLGTSQTLYDTLIQAKNKLTAFILLYCVCQNARNSKSAYVSGCFSSSPNSLFTSIVRKMWNPIAMMESCKEEESAVTAVPMLSAEIKESQNHTSQLQSTGGGWK